MRVFTIRCEGTGIDSFSHLGISRYVAEIMGRVAGDPLQFRLFDIDLIKQQPFVFHELFEIFGYFIWVGLRKLLFCQLTIMGFHGLLQRRIDPLHDVLRDAQADHKADHQADQCAEQHHAQLVEVLAERHRARFE